MSAQKFDVLAFGAHPDDVELACAGTLAKLIAGGKKVGIIDLTQGELGTRGTTQTRSIEAANSVSILGVSVRENLNLRDGFIRNDEPSQLKVIEILRKYQPEIIFVNAKHDRHPDHSMGGELVATAAFLAGLEKIKTQYSGIEQEKWRPKKTIHYIQDRLMLPSFVVDISDTFLKKMEAVKAFESQFHNQQSKEPETYISSVAYLKFVEARCREMGHLIGVEFGEGFVLDTPPKIENLFDLI